EVAIFLANLGGKIFKNDAVLFQRVDNCLFSLGIVPAGEKVVQRGKFRANRLTGEVLVGLGNQVAVRANVFDALGDDLGGHAADSDLLDTFAFVATLPLVLTFGG